MRRKRRGRKVEEKRHVRGADPKDEKEDLPPTSRILFCAITMMPYIHVGPFALGTFGILMWLAFLASFFALRADFARRNLAADPHLIVSVMALAGLAGSKLYHVLETPRDFLADPAGMIFSRTGFAWFGGFMAGIAVLIFFARHYQISILTLMDAASPAAALGYAVGRIGCLVSGDGDYGIPTTLPWCMRFPHGLVPTNECVHPTPIYEFLAGVVIFLVLWRMGRKQVAGARPSGRVVAVFFVLSGVARFLVEFIRINPRSFFGLSNAQAASLMSMVAGLVLLVAMKRRGLVAE